MNIFSLSLSVFFHLFFHLFSYLLGGSEPFEERFYTQPGNPLSPKNSQVRPPRRKLPFSLRDTPLTLKAKEAGRAGLSIEGYEQKLLEGEFVSNGTSASAASTASPGTFAATAHATLSAEEEKFLEAGHDEDELLTTIQNYQRIVDDYETVINKDAASGVAKAKAIVAESMENLRKLRAINAKLTALSETFDAQSVERAFGKMA
jgi:hypothetical protein